MSNRPYVLLSAAMSVDGCLDDASDTRLLLSNAEDFDRVDEVRASVDAILVGANTIRTDNPRLLVRSPQRRRQRVDAGRTESPTKVTVTATGRLAATADFFTVGEVDKLVYAPTGVLPEAVDRLGGVATVVDGGRPLDLHAVLADLAGRRIERLMVEGGTRTNTLFLTAGVVDELHLAVAPLFVGDAAAPRFVDPGAFPHDPRRPMRLAEARRLGDVVLLRYLLSESS